MAQLVSSAEAVKGKKQHTKACADCPMARTALKGWLGGATPMEYKTLAHSDTPVGCHTISNMKCAGMAVYRKNVAQYAEYRLPADRVAIFANPQEFLNHHERI